MMLENLANDQLIFNLDKIISNERKITTLALLYFIEVMRRELYLVLGNRTMFDFLTQRFKYSDGAAGHRLGACRVLKQYPFVKGHLLDGSLSITTLQQLSFHMGLK